jgi:hypothetical protein
MHFKLSAKKKKVEKWFALIRGAGVIDVTSQYTHASHLGRLYALLRRLCEQGPELSVISSESYNIKRRR